MTKKSYCRTDSQTGVCGIISIQSTFIKQLLCARGWAYTDQSSGVSACKSSQYLNNFLYLSVEYFCLNEVSRNSHSLPTCSSCANFRQPLPLGDGWIFFPCLLWHGECECLTEDLGVQSAAALVFSLFLSSFPFFASDMQLKSNTLWLRLDHIWSLFLPFFQTEKTPVCLAIGFN